MNTCLVEQENEDDKVLANKITMKANLTKNKVRINIGPSQDYSTI